MSSEILPTKCEIERNLPFLYAAKRPILDIILSLVLGFTIEYFGKIIGPVKVGFFCNDPTIRLIRLPQLVDGAMLMIFCFGMSISCIILVELYSIYFVDRNEIFVDGEIQKPMHQRVILRFLNVFSLFMVRFFYQKCFKFKVSQKGLL
uniref:Uncharacterized protein n=1 Tax=Panagrolaimus davidi TaxID=227884 RepID=A0A914PAA0_9BILA